MPKAMGKDKTFSPSSSRLRPNSACGLVDQFERAHADQPRWHVVPGDLGHTGRYEGDHAVQQGRAGNTAHVLRRPGFDAMNSGPVDRDVHTQREPGDVLRQGRQGHRRVSEGPVLTFQTIKNHQRPPNTWHHSLESRLRADIRLPIWHVHLATMTRSPHELGGAPPGDGMHNTPCAVTTELPALSAINVVPSSRVRLLGAAVSL